MTVAEAIKTGKAMLADGNVLPPDAKFVPSPTPALDINCILEHILQKDRTYLLIHRDEDLSSEQEQAFLVAVEKRRTGLPVAYITGHKEFYGLDFYVTPDVLIPKPDTELLVEHAVAEATGAGVPKVSAPNAAGVGDDYKIADICTGSGCIIISVLNELLSSGAGKGKTAIKAYASDISEAALKIAKTNATRLLPDTQINFLQGDLFAAFPKEETFDLILSNPPYIPSTMVTELLKDGRSEPVLALDGDVEEAGSASPTNDGLSIIRRLIPQAYSSLNKGGLFLVESGEYNAEETASLMKQAGFSDVEIFKDLAGQLRLTQGRR